MQRTLQNGLAVGDLVVSFRGVLGTVVHVETGRGPGRSDKVQVVDEDGNNWWNYETVWEHR